MSIAGTVGAPTWGYSGDRAWHRFYIPLQKYGRCRQIRLWWHQMSPDVRILTEKQVVILLFKSGCWNKIWSEKTSFCVNTAWQSEFMRILCSSEQSKLCPCRTKSLLSDKNQLAGFSWGFFSKVEKSNQRESWCEHGKWNEKIILGSFLSKKEETIMPYANGLLLYNLALNG